MELFNKVTAGRLALPEKVRVNLLALGDVGSTLLLGLRLMGGDVISSIGICDVRENAALRWEFELNQIQPPSGAALPPVEIVSPEQLFDGDVFLFCASRFVPDTAVKTGDVRMAQYRLNRELAALYARRKSACCSASRKAGTGWSAIQSGMGGSAGAGASVEAGVTSAGGVGVSAVGAAQAPRTSARPAANSTSGRFTLLTPPPDTHQWPGGAYR